MNPTDYWYYSNVKVKQYMDDYFKENVSASILSASMKNKLIWFYDKGNAMEKGQVITVVAAVQKYFKV
ncbi:MAG: hypothetical protein RR415_13055 [Ruthenibacterium sp.]